MKEFGKCPIKITMKCKYLDEGNICGVFPYDKGHKIFDANILPGAVACGDNSSNMRHWVAKHLKWIIFEQEQIK